MRILKLELENIKSLKGHFVIDFTKREFEESGLFLITGPTGSGKSTLLEAITLAFFAKSPSSGEVNGNRNELMSKNCGYCSSLVTFSINDTIYTVEYYQAKAKQKVDGNLQAPRRRLYNKTTGEIITDKISGFNQKVAELTTLNYDQFLLSVVLAQGKFDSFLTSKSNERAELLEHITNTSIYSELGIQIYGKYKKSQEKYDNICREQGNIEVLSEDDIALINEELLNIGKEKAKLEEQLNAYNALLSFLEEETNYNNSLSSLKSREEQLVIKQEGFKDGAIKLEAARRAQSISPIFNSLLQRRDEKAKYLNEIEENTTLLKSITLKEVEVDGKLKEANSVFSVLEQGYQSEIEQIKKVRKLDYDIEALKSLIRTNTVALSELKIDTLKDENQRTALKKAKVSKDKSELEEKLSTFKDGAELHSSVSSLKSVITRLEDNKNSIKETEEKLTKENENFGKLSASSKDTLRLLEALKTEAVELNNKLNKLALCLSADECVELDKVLDRIDENSLKCVNLSITQEANKIECEEVEERLKIGKERLADKEHILALFNQNQHLSSLLSALKENEPCPLCGSVDHPHIFIDKKSQEKAALEDAIKAARKNVETLSSEYNKKDISFHVLQNEIQNITKSIRHDEELIPKNLKKLARSKLCENVKEAKELYQALSVNNGKLIETEHAAESEQNKQVLLENSISYLNKELSKLLAEVERTETEVKLQLEKHQAVSYEALLKMDEEYLSLSSAFTKATDELIRLDKELTRSSTELLEKERQEAEYKQTIAQKEKELEEIKRSRFELYGDKNADIEEERVNAELKAARCTLENLRLEFNEIIGRKTSTEDYLKGLVEKSKVLAVRLEQELLDFSRKYQELGFVSEDDYIKACLTQAVLSALTKEENDINELRNNIIGQKEILEKTANTLRNKRALIKLELTKEEAEQHRKEDLQSVDSLTTHSAELVLKLNENEKRKAQIALILEEKAKAEEEAKFWRLMNDFAGSANGDTFRRYAQTLTLKVLIANANEVLKSMFPRYSLIPDPEEALCLSVKDYHQNGIDRKVNTLSGGERFIVSLSLALALSNMNSKNMSIDTFFLDEGFGTLSNEVLEDVLNVLTSFREKGKLIGLISHVEKLKEVIDLQLEVIPNGKSGYSSLSGIGVSCNKE